MPTQFTVANRNRSANVLFLTLKRTDCVFWLQQILQREGSMSTEFRTSSITIFLNVRKITSTALAERAALALKETLFVF